MSKVPRVADKDDFDFLYPDLRKAVENGKYVYAQIILESMIHPEDSDSEKARKAELEAYKFDEYYPGLRTPIQKGDFERAKEVINIEDSKNRFTRWFLIFGLMSVSSVFCSLALNHSDGFWNGVLGSLCIFGVLFFPSLLVLAISRIFTNEHDWGIKGIPMCARLEELPPYLTILIWIAAIGIAIVALYAALYYGIGSTPDV